jgi:DHA3 family macrolide efflux protein-like MFS transporter
VWGQKVRLERIVLERGCVRLDVHSPAARSTRLTGRLCLPQFPCQHGQRTLHPLLLGLSTPDTLGYVNSIGGLGMLVGTLLMSAWGGPKRRIYGIFAAETLLGLITFLFGLGLSIPPIAINNFWFLLAMRICNGCSQAIWQTKVAAGVQGRAFAIRRMIAFSIIPIVYTVAGPLAEQVFEPSMAAGGALASVLRPLIGVRPGRGIAMIFVIAGVLYTLTALVILIHPPIRRVEAELPDAIPDTEQQFSLDWGSEPAGGPLEPAYPQSAD